MSWPLGLCGPTRLAMILGKNAHLSTVLRSRFGGKESLRGFH